MPKKLALLIGINEYPHMAAKYQLGGCVNDAKLWRQVLSQKFAFSRENIVTLFNLEATREAILQAMSDTLDKLGNDDIFVFMFAGHGHQCKIKTKFSDEGSGKLNSILPCDDSEPKLGTDNLIWREIREHEIQQWLTRIAEKTSYTTLIFDACHSATMTRSAAEYSERFVPEHVRAQIAELNTEESISTRQSNLPWLSLNDNYVVISGCRDTQTSKEIFFYEDSSRFKHGVLSYSMCQALRESTAGDTYRDVFEKVTTKVLSLVEAQHPQIEGRIDRELFGTRDIEALPFIPVTSINNDQIGIDAGAAHGICVGTICNVYQPFSKEASETNLVASICIKQVFHLHSIAEPLKVIRNIELGARCIVHTQTASEKKLTVYLQELPTSLRSAIKTQFMTSPLVSTSHEKQAADLTAKLCESLEALPLHLQEATDSNKVFPKLIFTDRQGALAMPEQSLSSPNMSEVVTENLEKIARYRRLLLLENKASKLPVEFNLYKRYDDNRFTLANGGSSHFSNRESMMLEIANHSANRTLFFSILWLSADKEIGHFYPPRKSCEELSPNTTIRIGDKRNKLSASLSPAFFGDIGVETIKVFFSSKPSDFSHIRQSGLRSHDNENNEEISALNSALHGAEQTVEHDDWQALSRSFVLSRQKQHLAIDAS